MISVNTFISDTLNTVDAVIGGFVTHAYQNFIQANVGLITLLLTVYVMFLGYRFINHEHHLNLSQIMRHMIVMLIAYALVMNWDFYNLFVYNIFTNEPGHIAKILVDSASHTPGDSIVQTLDGIYKSICDAATGFFGQDGFSSSGIAFFFYGALVWLIGTAMCVYALLLFIYAKMTMAVMLALGPVFILFMLWNPTKTWFSAWLGQLMTLALIPVVTSAVLVLMLSVINVTLPSLNQPMENMQFYGIVPFLGLSLATAMILSRVISICSALGGSFNLASLSDGADIAKNSLEYSGVTPATRYIANKLLGRKNKRTGGR